MRAIFEIDGFDSGKIILETKELSIGSPIDAMNSGIALVSENRK